MQEIYSILKISKQGVWKYERHLQAKQILVQEAVSRMINIRKVHKRMGCRKMFEKCRDLGIGRDEFMQIGYANGFKLGRKYNPVKTTRSQKLVNYPNLIDGIEITGINQVWQSDITYLEVEGLRYFAVCVIDLYSRKILAIHVSQSLRALENVAALRKAIKHRDGAPVAGCIFHTDRGTQYTSLLHKAILDKYNMKPSMGIVAQENAYIERFHGTLKYEYLMFEHLTTKNIKSTAARIMKLYNNDRPHESLKMITPTKFEQQLEYYGDNRGPVMRIHKWNDALSTEYQVVNKEKRSKKERLPIT